MNLLLDTTTRTLTGQLSATPSTGVSVLVSYADKTSSSLTYGLTPTSLTNTTETTICAAPAASTQRLVKDADVRVTNPGTVSVDFTLRIDDNGTKYIVNTVTVAAGESVNLSFDTSATELTVNSTTLVYNDLAIGAVAPLITTSVPDGWLLANGTTIGSSTSGSSARANADTYTLFCILYNEWSDTTSPVLTSAGAGTTRAAQGTAATAFAAGVRVTLPDLTGRVVAGKEASQTRLTSTGSGVNGGTLGASGGSEFMQSHSHVKADGAFSAGSGGSGTVTKEEPGGGTYSTKTAGTGSSQNVQPTIVLPYIVKYKNSGVAVPVTTLGVVDGSSAAVGTVGEVARGTDGGSYIYPASATWTNVAQVTLSAGDWDISGVVYHGGNGGTLTGDGAVSVSAYSGATTTDHVLGDNVVGMAQANSSGSSGASVPGFRASFSGSPVTYYLKVNISFSSGSPYARGRISARRVR